MTSQHWPWLWLAKLPFIHWGDSTGTQSTWSIEAFNRSLSAVMSFSNHSNWTTLKVEVKPSKTLSNYQVCNPGNPGSKSAIPHGLASDSPLKHPAAKLPANAISDSWSAMPARIPQVVVQRKCKCFSLHVTMSCAKYNLLHFFWNLYVLHEGVVYMHVYCVYFYIYVYIYIYTRTHVYNTHMYFYIDVYIHICIFTYMFGMHVLVHWRVVPRMTLALLHIAWCNAAKKSLYQLNHKANVCMSCVAHAQDRRAHTMYFYEQIEFYVIAF